VINWSQHPKINLAVQQLHLQGVIAYPTEAVWGLGCDPYSHSAVARILALKRRPERKGLILIGCDWQQFAPFIDCLDKQQLTRLKKNYQKPITWLIPHNGAAPPWIVGEYNTLAVRVTSHPVAASLCRLFGGPMVSTSANPQGLPAAVTGLKVNCYFNGRLNYQTSGSVGSSTSPSEIRHLLTSEVIRQG
jgi:L-threonylcarbamoyladenylate synthase